ncbi:hypothetical protein WMF26_50415 [Sorangium sp. So ce185]|uniref:hypothetical protein n=1 Tax=Sorangium sp. So ce185 TaxID=3133287 RepID=UPI003F62A79D
MDGGLGVIEVSRRPHQDCSREATGLPKKIASGLAALREKGMAAAALDAVQARLDAGDVKGAAIAYDAAVRGAEGT